MDFGLEGFFADSYADARKLFLAAADAAGFSILSMELEGVVGPDGGPLYIDLAHRRGADLEPDDTPDAAFLHCSGTHGVEGFVGSAIQVKLLREVAAGRRPELLPPPRGMTVLVHAVNPFGFAWRRRFTRANCDLNRNWLVPKRFEELAAEGLPLLFDRYRSLVAPAYVPDPDSYAEWAWTRAQAGMAILQHGLDALKEAVARGHHCLPEAMYFGGVDLQPEPRLVIEGLRLVGVIQPAGDPPAEAPDADWTPFAAGDAAGLWEGHRGPRRLVVVDVHSGLGEPAQSSLLLDGTDGGREAAAVRAAMGVEAHDAAAGPKRAVVQDGSALGSTGVAYQMRGGLSEAMATIPGPAGMPHGVSERGAAAAAPAYAGLRPEDRVTLAQEFGTIPPTEVFFALRAENALFQADPEAPVTHPHRHALLRAFYPEDAAWRRSCLAQGVTVAAALARHAFA